MGSSLSAHLGERGFRPVRIRVQCFRSPYARPSTRPGSLRCLFADVLPIDLHCDLRTCLCSGNVFTCPYRSLLWTNHVADFQRHEKGQDRHTRKAYVCLSRCADLVVRDHFCCLCSLLNRFCRGEQTFRMVIIRRSTDVGPMYQGYSTGLPVWGLLLAALVVAVYIIPGGYIYALSSQAVRQHFDTIHDSMTTLTSGTIAHCQHHCRDYTELSLPWSTDRQYGKLQPSRIDCNRSRLTNALQLFKAFTVNTLQLGLYYIQDLKLGHYMKVPPRVTFSGEHSLYFDFFSPVTEGARLTL